MKLIEKFIEKKDIHVGDEELLLINCIIGGDIEIIKLLIEHGANIKYM